MKLKFEKWLERQSKAKHTETLFKEAIMCYKMEAYRASLLFSYLGLLTVIRDRLVKANKPQAIVQGLWDDLQRKLVNENKWEEAAFDATQNSTHVIFPVSEQLRLQLKYWRDRRNDSAHFKDNEISHHHTESLWTFIESNLSKITIAGGKEELLLKFRRHYDPALTPPNKDVTPLILEIEQAVETVELPSFFEELRKQIEILCFSRENFFKCCNLMQSALPERVTEKLIDYLKANRSIMIDYLHHSPSGILRMNLEAHEIRELWTTHLNVYKEPLRLYAALLRNNLIPEEEIPEANNTIFNKINQPASEIEDIKVLKEKGFDQVLYEKVFTENKIDDFNYTNHRDALILDYVIRNPFDDLIVKRICSTFDSYYYSWGLADKLNSFFENNAGRKAEFIEIAARNTLSLPENIPALR